MTRVIVKVLDLCTTITGDSQHIISGSYDFTVIIWSLKVEEQLDLLKGHENLVSGVCYLDDRSLIFS